MSFGVTPQGFIRKTRQQILESQRANARIQLGENIDLSDQSPDGLRLQAQTDELDLLWQTLESIYYSNFLDTATGVSLDRVIAAGGQERAQPKRAIVQLTFAGVPEAPIELGIIVQTPQGIQYITIEESVIGVSETGTCLAQCLDFGEIGNVPEASINEILTPKNGIESVTNLTPASLGRKIETDPETVRRYRERGVAGGSSAANLQSLLNNLQSVITARVYENDTSVEDEEGRPPNSMQAVIEGGSPEEFGELFVRNWPGGIQSIGEESITVIDNKGENRTYYYDRPTDVRVYAKLVITTNSSFIEGSESIIKTNCIKIVGGIDTIGDSSKTYTGKGLGESLYSWELEAAQLGIEDFDTVRVFGITNITATIGLTDTPIALILEATGSERLKLNTEDIEIEFV
ncbi:MAG: phage baseplate protein [Leptospira sp.]|nr:phage baseplate protein [Leptospira sp.]